MFRQQSFQSFYKIWLLGNVNFLATIRYRPFYLGQHLLCGAGGEIGNLAGETF